MSYIRIATLADASKILEFLDAKPKELVVPARYWVKVEDSNTESEKTIVLKLLSNSDSKVFISEYNNQIRSLVSLHLLKRDTRIESILTTWLTAKNNNEEEALLEYIKQAAKTFKVETIAFPQNVHKIAQPLTKLKLEKNTIIKV